MRLPVEPERLKRSFPSLTDEDLAAYAAVTKALLGDPRSRGDRLAEILSKAQRAREKEAVAAPPDPDERLCLAYLRALEKIQGG